LVSGSNFEAESESEVLFFISGQDHMI
jgi:hypothetical protein